MYETSNAMAKLAIEALEEKKAEEERKREEVTHINGKIICSDKVNIINPGFDVTPNELITGIITEKGIIRHDYKQSIAKLFV